MTTATRIGLVLFALLSIADIAGLFLTDGSHPPYAIAAVSAVLGVASLAVLPAAWRGGRTATRALTIMRIGSALTAVPAFFVAGAGSAAVVSAAAIVLVTAVAVILVAPSMAAPAVIR